MRINCIDSVDAPETRRIAEAVCLHERTTASGSTPRWLQNRRSSAATTALAIQSSSR